MALDPTTGAKLLKRVYPYKVLVDMTKKDTPLTSWMPKRTDFVGSHIVVPVAYAHGTGRSTTFATAQANKSNTAVENYLVTRVKNYSLGSITYDMILASEKSDGAFERGLDREVKSCTNALANSVEQQAFGDGANDIGRIATTSTVTTDTISLETPADAFKFFVGQKLVAAAARATGSVRSGTVTVESVDPDAGTITATAHWDDGISGLTAGDYLFNEGDRVTATLLGMSGLKAWLPDTNPTSGDNFFGVDRSVDPHKLAGGRVDASSWGSSPLDKIQEGLKKLNKNGADVDTIFVPYEIYTQIDLELDAKRVISTLDIEDVGVGFDAISVNNGKGKGAKIVAAPCCPADRAYCLNRDSWVLWTAREHLHFQNLNGKLLTESAADGFEFRLASYGNVVCQDPQKNGVILL